MFQPFDLSGRGAVITGGNGGIGYGMARALLAAGAHVSIWGSRAEKTEQARAALAAECGAAFRLCRPSGGAGPAGAAGPARAA